MEELLRTLKMLLKGLDNRHQLTLAFTLGQEEYSRGVLKVEKVLGLMPVGLIPHRLQSVKWKLFFPGEMPVDDSKGQVSGVKIALTDKKLILVGEVALPQGSDLIGFLLDAGSFP